MSRKARVAVTAVALAAMLAGGWGAVSPAVAADGQTTVQAERSGFTAWAGQVHGQLAIRPDQEAAWQNYLKALDAAQQGQQGRRNAMWSMMRSGGMYQMSPEARQQFHSAMHGGAQQQWAALQQARADLLKVLDPAQRQKASGLLY